MAKGNPQKSEKSQEELTQALGGKVIETDPVLKLLIGLSEKVSGLQDIPDKDRVHIRTELQKIYDGAFTTIASAGKVSKAPESKPKPVKDAVVEGLQKLVSWADERSGELGKQASISGFKKFGQWIKAAIETISGGKLARGAKEQYKVTKEAVNAIQAFMQASTSVKNELSPPPVKYKKPPTPKRVKTAER